MENKPKEFWIRKTKGGHLRAHSGPYNDSAGLIHVIEYDEYRALQTDYERYIKETIEVFKKTNVEIERLRNVLAERKQEMRKEIEDLKKALDGVQGTNG